jgi:ferrous iron transport protein B
MSERAPLNANDAPLPGQGRGVVLLVGNPNVGKSALFGALTGSYVTVSNYPGTTVEVTRGSFMLNEVKTTILDSPGANSFLPTSEDERVTRDMLLKTDAAAVVVVGDAKNIPRTVLLGMQMAEIGLPWVFCLNMMDEADNRGLEIDQNALGKELGVQVVPTVAVRKRGLEKLRECLPAASPGQVRIEYPADIEAAILQISPLLPSSPVSGRALALMVLSDNGSLDEWLSDKVDADALQTVVQVRSELHEGRSEPLVYSINMARHSAANRIVAKVAKRNAGSVQPRNPLWKFMDRYATHRIWGFPILAVILYGMYQFVGIFGAGTVVGWLEEGLFGTYINPVAISLSDRFIPIAWIRDLLVGEYGIITMALTYSFALVFPIVGTFFLAFGALEDSGYLPRLAVMVNKGFRKIGLNGKAVLPMVLGLGCDTMATLTTRILETKKERLIVIILLALGVPCSAQLTVILAMLGSLAPLATFIWIGVILGVIFLVGALSSRFLPGRSGDFIMELPPMRTPRLGNIVVKTVARIEWYLKEAVPLFVLGTLILFIADRLQVLGVVERAAEPILKGLLGLPKETAATFIIGFLRRDFGVAGLYHMAQEGTLDPIQILVAVTAITLFIPCIANLFMIVKERGVKTAAAISLFIFPFALLVGATLNLVLRLVPLPLG